MPKTTNRLSQYNALESSSRISNISIPLKGEVLDIDSWTIKNSKVAGSTVQLILSNPLSSEYSGEHKVVISNLSQLDVQNTFGGATTTESSDIISGLSGMTSAYLTVIHPDYDEDIGWSVYGNGIPEGTRIVQIINPTTIRINTNATITQTGTASIRISPYGFTGVDPDVVSLNNEFTVKISGSSVVFATPLEWSFLQDLPRIFSSLRTNAKVMLLYNHQWTASRGTKALSIVSDFYDHKSRYSLYVQPSGTEPVTLNLNFVNKMFAGDNGKDFSFNAKIYCSQKTSVDCSLSVHVYQIGDIGPAGGIVFITPETPGNTTGKYFEASPGFEPPPASWNTVEGDPQAWWSTPVYDDVETTGADGEAIGTGYQNTLNIISQGNTTNTAASVCRAYSNNGFTDWFLPSKNELIEIGKNYKIITGLDIGANYWSSTEKTSDSAWRIKMPTSVSEMVVSGGPKNAIGSGHLIRPVRMFTFENSMPPEPVQTVVYPGRFTAVRSNIQELPISNEESYFLDVSITFSGHNAQPFYITSPHLIEDFLYHSNPYVYSAKRSMPDFYWHMDSLQENPSSPLHRLIDCMMTGARDVYDEYIRIYVYEPGQLGVLSEQIETNNVHSTLVNPDYVNPRYAPWLSQFNGHKLKKNIEYTTNSVTSESFDEPQPMFESAGAKESFIKWQLKNGYYGRAAGTMEALKEATKQVLHYMKVTKYEIGDIGPAGGFIFITPETPGNTSGEYYEVAPLSTEVIRTHSQSTPIDYQSTHVFGAEGQNIGDGPNNTAAIVAQGNNNPATSAAAYCNSLEYGGKKDWFLPSRNEGGYFYDNLAVNSLGDFSTSIGNNYWTSSEYTSISVNTAFTVNTYNTNSGPSLKSDLLQVRAVRKFKLEGSSYFVSVTPHYQSDPFKILIRTLVSETFDCNEDLQESSAILDAVELARPMGYKIYHQARDVVEFTIGDTLAGFRLDGTYVPGNTIGDGRLILIYPLVLKW